jgi:adenine deaminase
MIAPGRYADVVLSRSLPDFAAELVIARGRIIARNGTLVEELPVFSYPAWATNSVHLGRTMTAADFRLGVPEDVHGKTAVANVIGVIENQAPTRHLRMEVSVASGAVDADMKKDIAKIALVERHQGNGGVQIGLVHGFGFDVPCAVGTTVAHDSHHMIVVGTDEDDMALAANELARVDGGQIVVRNGEVLGLVELPIAGLMSNERAEVVAEKAATVLAGFRACGCQLNNPNMQLSLLALVVIPELRISDKGLVDVNDFKLVPVLTSV